MPSIGPEPSIAPNPSEFPERDEAHRFRVTFRNQGDANLFTVGRGYTKRQKYDHDLTLDHVPALPKGEQTIHEKHGADFYKCQERDMLKKLDRSARKRERERVPEISVNAKVWVHVRVLDQRFPVKMPFDTLANARSTCGHESRKLGVERVDVFSDGYLLESWVSGRKTRV